MKLKFLRAAAAGLMLTVCSIANAGLIINNFGLTSSDNTITFDEIVFAGNTVVDTQYASLGLTFTSGLKYDAQGSSSFPGISGHYLGNFTPVINPFSIFFSDDQTEAAFGLATNPQTTTFNALLNGVLVESFSTSTSANNSSQGFYGFTGILFDEIQVASNSGSALIDNIQFNNSSSTAVPEPSTLAIFALGIMGLAARRFKKQ
ncbi:PEP-CTERM sorting domain-containing protein [Cognaticolwellia beringensis]|uniref:PEP-CTERM sorting domain-containing protein n=1 Tax=Cognaticolwellia beringensis TaxID=1967665 RepID=A0A222G9Z2_9GAMM|nr:PEP-CTERM sorting domain-containing protein [Cognaticolwellia beringensis]ASP48542.1 PEP-CTERM sorting domain-containing protein [Cognaticolwellia beringensis]